MAMANTKTSMAGNFRIVLLACTFTLLAYSSGAQAFQNADSAFQKAALDQKFVLLFFTGSDWCSNCLRLEKNILSQTEFVEFANENLVLLNADFPQRKKLSPEQTVQNESLAEKYNPQGSFPTLLLINSEKTHLKYLYYSNQDKNEFLKMLNKELAALHEDE